MARHLSVEECQALLKAGYQFKYCSVYQTELYHPHKDLVYVLRPGTTIYQPRLLVKRS